MSRWSEHLLALLDERATMVETECGSIQLAREGSLAVASVVSSQYAAVAVLLGVLVRGQRMWWWQGLGLGGSSIAVALIAIG